MGLTHDAENQSDEFELMVQSGRKIKLWWELEISGQSFRFYVTTERSKLNSSRNEDYLYEINAY